MDINGFNYIAAGTGGPGHIILWKIRHDQIQKTSSSMALATVRILSLPMLGCLCSQFLDQISLHVYPYLCSSLFLLSDASLSSYGGIA